jgi:prevent-host-death family protein
LNRTWPLQEAKNRLSYLVEQANSTGPQTITVRGHARAVLLSAEEYERLTRPPQSLIDFFQQSPLVGVDLDLERDRDPGRDVAI